MEDLAHQLAKYSYNLKYSDLSEKVIREAKRRIIDTLGCGMGAFNAEPVRIVRELAKNVTSEKPATLLGTNYKTSPELATFVNGTMTRYLDFMDTYFPLGEFVHPEDMLASIFAVAESEKATGKDIILAIVLAYEVSCRFVDWTNIRKRGWDHVIWITIASTLAVSKILKLSLEKTAEAVSIAIASNIPLRQIRVGKLSMWKALAVAYATKAAVFASYLARDGITGPTEIFEGKMGFFNQITGKTDFSVENFTKHGSNFKIFDVTIKKWPVESSALSAVEAAFELRKKIKNINEIEKINIQTFETAYTIIADKEKWNPTNRETADHSLPYIVCVALTDGIITEKQFSMQRILDPKIRDLLQRTTVEMKEEYNRYTWPGRPNKIEIVTKSGKKFFEEAVYPRGSSKNPLSDEDIEEKFRDLTKRYLSKKQIDIALKTMWNFDKVKDINKFLKLFAVR